MTLRTVPIIAVMAKTLPRNADVADQFDLLADFLELEGSDQFRPLAYRRAAQRMRETGGSIAQLALDGKAKDLSGIGKTIEEKIVQIVEDGKIEALAEREQRIPPDVVEFMHLPGPRPEDRAPHLAGARRLDARRAEEGRRVGAAPHAHRARPEDRGERPQGARHAEEEDRAQAAPRPGAPGRASRRRGPPRAPRRRSGQRSGQRPPPQGAGSRPRHHRHGQRPQSPSSTTSRS